MQNKICARHYSIELRLLFDSCCSAVSITSVMAEKQTRSKGLGLNTPDTSETNIGIFMKQMENKFETMKKEMFQKIDNENKDARTSREFISSQYDDLNTKMNTIANLVSEVENLRKELNEKNLIIKNFEIRLASLEQTSKEDALEVAGIPPCEGEQPSETVKKLAAAVGVELLPHDILEAKRIPDRRPGAPPKICIRFTDIRKRNLLLINRKKIHHDILKYFNCEKIFISAILNPYFKELLWKTKQICKEKKFSYVWYKDEKILVKKSATDKIIYIKHSDDLCKII